MSATRLLPEEGLAPYFDMFTKEFLTGGRPRAVDVEVLELEFGDQYPVVGARLLGIVYDADTGELAIALDSGDHRVKHPRQVWIVEEPDGFLAAMQLVLAAGRKEVITLKRVGLRRV